MIDHRVMVYLIVVTQLIMFEEIYRDILDTWDMLQDWENDG